MYYSLAERHDLPIIAAMHIEPSKEGMKQAANHCNIYEFYMDKAEFFFQCEREGMIVARDGSEVVGFVIVTKSIKRLNVLSLVKGYLAKSIMKTLIGKYGLSGHAIRWYMRIPLAFFRIFRVKPSEEKTRTKIRHVDAEIRGLIVLEEKRGQGIGTELMKRATEYLSKQGIAELGLTVSPENIVARRLYEKLGFVEKGGYQEGKGKRLYMVKSLQ